jgi:hypothetical protein
MNNSFVLFMSTFYNPMFCESIPSRQNSKDVSQTYTCTLYIITRCPNKPEKSCVLTGLSNIRLKLTWPQFDNQLTMLDLRINKYRTYLQLKTAKQMGVAVTDLDFYSRSVRLESRPENG